MISTKKSSENKDGDKKEDEESNAEAHKQAAS